jgi:hypothetical protein
MAAGSAPNLLAPSTAQLRAAARLLAPTAR